MQLNFDLCVQNRGMRARFRTLCLCTHQLSCIGPTKPPGSRLSCCTPLRSDIVFAVVVDTNGFAGAHRREYIENQSVLIHPPELLAAVQLRCPTPEGLRHSGLDGGLAQFGVWAHEAKLERSLRDDPGSFVALTPGCVDLKSSMVNSDAGFMPME